MNIGRFLIGSALVFTGWMLMLSAAITVVGLPIGLAGSRRGPGVDARPAQPGPTKGGLTWPGGSCGCGRPIATPNAKACRYIDSALSLLTGR
jgi:hypothetical protein